LVHLEDQGPVLDFLGAVPAQEVEHLRIGTRLLQAAADEYPVAEHGG
jgi:hypothetical protein